MPKKLEDQIEVEWVKVVGARVLLLRVPREAILMPDWLRGLSNELRQLLDECVEDKKDRPQIAIIQNSARLEALHDDDLAALGLKFVGKR